MGRFLLLIIVICSAFSNESSFATRVAPTRRLGHWIPAGPPYGPPKPPPRRLANNPNYVPRESYPAAAGVPNFSHYVLDRRFRKGNQLPAEELPLGPGKHNVVCKGTGYRVMVEGELTLSADGKNIEIKAGRDKFWVTRSPVYPNTRNCWAYMNYDYEEQLTKNPLCYRSRSADGLTSQTMEFRRDAEGIIIEVNKARPLWLSYYDDNIDCFKETQLGADCYSGGVGSMRCLIPNKN